MAGGVGWAKTKRAHNKNARPGNHRTRKQQSGRPKKRKRAESFFCIKCGSFFFSRVRACLETARSAAGIDKRISTALLFQKNTRFMTSNAGCKSRVRIL